MPTEAVWPEPVAHITSAFHIPETHAAITLQPYQQAVIREMFRLDANGHYPYSTVVWSDIKKSAKSTIAAAIADYVATHTPLGSLKIVANDLKQADSRVAYYLRRHHLLAKSGVKIKNYLVEYPNGARVEAIPVDPKGEAGGNDDLVIFSELWAANQKAALSMWTEMTLSPTKYGRSMRLVETYAGRSAESPLLEQLYQQGVKEGRQLDLSQHVPGHDISDLEVYANDALRLLVLWNTTPRCTWQTNEYYAQEAAVLTPNEFQRVHRNQWVSSEDVFVPAAWWDACRVADIPPLGDFESIVVGIDAAVTSDCFAIVAVSRPDRERCIVRYARIWSPPKGGVIDFAEPEAELRRLANEFYVAQFTYDPYQLADMASRLRKAGVGWFKEFQQQAPRLIADKMLYDMIRERRILHDGNLALTEHVRNANRKTEGDGEKLRIVKRAEHLHVDACVALSMAVDQAMRLNL